MSGIIDVSLCHTACGLEYIFHIFLQSCNALVFNTQISITDELAAAEPEEANDFNVEGIKFFVESGVPSEALGRIGNTIKSLTAHIVELREAIVDNKTSEAMVAAFNSMKNKCFNVKDVVTGGSRKRRQTKKRKNHNNNNQ